MPRKQPLIWNFPLRRPHAGVPLANGVQGLLVWGHDRELRISIARQGFWDRRGGNDAILGTTYQQVRTLVEQRDEIGLREIFGRLEGMSGKGTPHQIGGGRLVVELPLDWKLKQASLDARGTIRVLCTGPEKETATLEIAQDPDSECAWISLPRELEQVKICLIPSAHIATEAFAEQGYAAPEVWSDANAWGFLQSLPTDESLGVQVCRKDQRLWILSDLGLKDRPAVEALAAKIPDIGKVERRHRKFWKHFAAEVPTIRLPDPALQEIIDFGLHKMACCTPPQGLACALQGPLMEEHRIPPWCNDYHFNINVQMIYLPALAAGRADHFLPLWDLLRKIWPRMQAMGRAFFRDEEALLLPHACSDRGDVVGSFWTGTIDQGCTAWMALMAWWYYRFTGDRAFLESFAVPFLRGAFAGYWAMLEDDGKGGLRLPVSVSPEFRGAAMDAWGVNASFQVAALHATVQALQDSAKILGNTCDSRWETVIAKVPPYATVVGDHWIEWPGTKVERIGLWQGQDLDFSHRHHSHLAGIFPFYTVDPQDPKHAKIVAESLHRWTLIGPGGWSGWCVPWAATLWARCGNADAWLTWMRHWQQVFVNEGRGTLHNAAFSGASGLDAPPHHRQPIDTQHGEIFQLDAGMGALTAVFELLIQERNDTIVILPAGLPMHWHDLSFAGLHVAGGFTIGAEVTGDRLTNVRVEASRDGHLTLWQGLGENRQLCQRAFKAGEVWTWEA